MYRFRDKRLEVLLVHPGGPYWTKKDVGAWSIPKGEASENEELLKAAKREFEEEMGFKPTGSFTALSPVKQSGGKVVHAWAFEGDCDPMQVRSNSFSIEWPPGSGKQQTFPEIDRAEWFTIEVALEKIVKGQRGLIDQLLIVLKSGE